MTEAERQELSFFRDRFGEDFFRNRPESGPRKRLAKTATKGKGQGEVDYEMASGGAARTRIFRTPENDIGASITYRVDAVLVDDPEVASTYEPLTLNGYAIMSGRDPDALFDQARQRAVERLEREVALRAGLDDFPVLAVRQKQEVSVVHVLPTEDELDARIEARLAKRAVELEGEVEARVAKEAERIAQRQLSEVVERLEKDSAGEVAKIRASAAEEVDAVRREARARAAASAKEIASTLIDREIAKANKAAEKRIKAAEDSVEKRIKAGVVAGVKAGVREAERKRAAASRKNLNRNRKGGK